MNKTLSQKVSELEETLKIILQISFILSIKKSTPREGKCLPKVTAANLVLRSLGPGLFLLHGAAS